eukprot:jgi/Antlo1/2011/325
MDTKEEEADVEPGEIIPGDISTYLNLKPSSNGHLLRCFVERGRETVHRQRANDTVEGSYEVRLDNRNACASECGFSSGLEKVENAIERDAKMELNEPKDSVERPKDMLKKRSLDSCERSNALQHVNDTNDMMEGHKALKRPHFQKEYKVEKDCAFWGGYVCNNEFLDALCSNCDKVNFDAFSSDADSASTVKCENSEHNSTEKVDTDVIKKDIIENAFYKKWYQCFFPKKRASSNALSLYTFRERKLAEHRARENEAVLDTTDPVLFISKRETSIKFDELDWSESEQEAFKTSFETFGKNFTVISKITNRDIKECITFYYRTKRKNEYRKKIGRYSDEQLKLVVESEWSPFEIKMYSQCLKLYKGNLLKFASLFPNKDLKTFRRYYKKFHEDTMKCKSTDVQKTEERAICCFANRNCANAVCRKKNEGKGGKNAEKNIAGGHYKEEMCCNWRGRKEASENVVEVLREWTMDERQLFAIYYPHFNKNWVKFAEYIKTKRISDFSRYFRFYFKKLTRNERNFEAYQCELEKDMYRNLFVGKKAIKRHLGDDYIESAGLLFRPHQ